MNTKLSALSSQLLAFIVVGLLWLTADGRQLSAALTVSNGPGVSNLTASAATLWANITSTNAPAVLHTNFIAHGSADAGTNLSSWAIIVTNTAAAFGKWSTTIALPSNSNHFYRAFARDTNGLVWASSTVAFTTPHGSIVTNFPYGTTHYVTIINTNTGTLTILYNGTEIGAGTGGGLSTNQVNNLIDSNLTANVFVRRDGAATNLTAAGSIVLDAALSNSNRLYSLLLTNHVSIVITNQAPGRYFFLELLQDAVGGHTSAWDSAILWENSQPLAITTNAYRASVVRLLGSAITNNTFTIASVNGTNYTFASVGGGGGGTALLFDGSQNYLAIPASSAFWLTNGFTVEFWANGPYSIGCQSGGSGFWALIYAVGESSFQVLTDTGDPYLNASVDTTGWHHWAFQYGTNGVLSMYRDGSLVGEPSGTGGLLNDCSDNEFRIGDIGGGANFVAGILDEVVLTSKVKYTGAFTPETCPTNWMETVGHWNLNDGSGVTAVDSSGNGHDGTLNGSPPPAWVTGECVP